MTVIVSVRNSGRLGLRVGVDVSLGVQFSDSYFSFCKIAGNCLGVR